MPRYQKSFNYKERFHSKKKTKPKDFYCKLRIDPKTIIMVRTKESYENWLIKYPNAVKIEFPI
jgi:hypothetical protein